MRQFNPLTSILNNGYDQVRTGPNRRVFEFDYDLGGTGAWNSILRAQRLVREYGTRDWLRYEIFPLSGKGGGGGRWVPNYQLHLFAGGVTYVRLIAWFERRDLPHPRMAAAATSFAGHFLNEMIENTALTRGSVDAMTDLVIFDPATILLWNSDRVQRFVGSRIEFTEWPGQPTLEVPGGTIENTFQTTSVVDTTTGRKTVELLGNVGLFVDRSGSLLGSLVLKSGFDAGATVNVYPGVARVGQWAPGFWAQWLRSNEVRFGLTTAWGVGVGRNPSP